MMPPGELVGGLACLWSVDADDSVVEAAIRQILRDSSWPEGQQRLEALTTPELRSEFVHECYKAEKKQVEGDVGGHNQKRQKTFFFNESGI